jgi:hypothetical protein
MIEIFCPGSRLQAAAVVDAALKRSCGPQLVGVASITRLNLESEHPGVTGCVFIDPPDGWSDMIIHTARTRTCKILLLGAIPSRLAGFLGMRTESLDRELVAAAACGPAAPHCFAESNARISYKVKLGSLESPIQCRPLLRYDFADEWNNLGYGAIRVDGSVWSLAQQVSVAPEACLAQVSTGSTSRSAYCAIWDAPLSSVLWFNRAVGPVDSQEWRLVEHFLSSYRAAELPCWPVLREIPHGYLSAVTMRLDCDEDVESARPLWELYRDSKTPFSLALHSSVLKEEQHHALPKELLKNNGAILSHTATHAPDWGGSYEAAYREASVSALEIRRATGCSVQYAVSPFHQTPDYARAALSDAGYLGCIGGIIRNDPDFLMARAGVPPGSPQGFIGHTQQCMFHGDCVGGGADPLAVFKQAFDVCKAGGAFFGYLDHPFSSRYQYGWIDEAQRVSMHREFLSYMRGSEKMLFCNEVDAMHFLNDKAAIQIRQDAARFHVSPVPSRMSAFDVSVEYKGSFTRIPVEGLLL